MPDNRSQSSKSDVKRQLPSRSNRHTGSLLDKQKIIPSQSGPQHELRRQSASTKAKILCSDISGSSSSRQTSASSASEESKTHADLVYERQERIRHNVRVSGDPIPSKQPGYQEVTSVSFVVCPETDEGKSITVKKGSWVLAEVETFGKEGETILGKEVALVLAVLVDGDGDVQLAMRWTWTWNSIFYGSEGEEALSNSRQIFLQRNHCLTGNQDQGPTRVQEKDGRYVDLCPWGAIDGIAKVRHRSQITNLKAFCAQSEANFFYSQEFDNASWRVSHVQPVDSTEERPFKRLKPSQLTMGDMFSGLGTVSLGATSAGMSVDYCVELDECAFNAAYMNTNQRLKLDRAMSLAEFIEGIEAERPGFPRPGDVAVLHLSPPCQSLSAANRTATVERIEEELYPILRDCVKLVKLLKPPFVTVEEVPQFLIKNLAQVGSDGKKKIHKLHPGLRLLAPLVEFGYQAQLSIVNSLFYGVPQHRKRAFAFFALPEYELPLPPPARYFCNLFQNRFWLRGLYDTMRRDILHWNSIYITPNGTFEGLKEAGNVADSARDFDVAEKQQMKDAEEGDLVTEDSDCVNLAAPKYSVANPRNLPGVPGAALALDDLGPAKIVDNSAETFCISRYQQSIAVSRYAAFCRTPLVRQGNQTIVEDHTVKALHTMSEKRTQTLLQRCMASAMQKPHLRVQPDGVFHTVCTIVDVRHMKGCMHHREPRLLSLAEKKRIQSIPDDVYLIGDEKQKSKQVGNAVPFLMARAIMDAVYLAATGLPPKPFPHVSGIVGDNEAIAKESQSCVDVATEEQSSADCATINNIRLAPDQATKAVQPESVGLTLDSESCIPPEEENRPCNPLVSALKQHSQKGSSGMGWSWVQKEDNAKSGQAPCEEGEVSSPDKPASQPHEQAAERKIGFLRPGFRQMFRETKPACPAQAGERQGKECPAPTGGSRQPETAVKGLSLGLQKAHKSAEKATIGFKRHVYLWPPVGVSAEDSLEGDQDAPEKALKPLKRLQRVAEKPCSAAEQAQAPKTAEKSKVLPYFMDPIRKASRMFFADRMAASKPAVVSNHAETKPSPPKSTAQDSSEGAGALAYRRIKEILGENDAQHSPNAEATGSPAQELARLKRKRNSQSPTNMVQPVPKARSRRSSSFSPAKDNILTKVNSRMKKHKHRQNNRKSGRKRVLSPKKEPVTPEDKQRPPSSGETVFEDVIIDLSSDSDGVDILD